MTLKISPWAIVVAQHKTYRTWNAIDRLRKLKVGDYALMWCLPILAGALVFAIEPGLSAILVPAITAVSILVALLLNLLVVVLDLAKTHEKALTQEANTLVRETATNISYSVLVALATLALLVVRLVEVRPEYIEAMGATLASYVSQMLAWACISMLVHVGLAVLMVLRRAYAVQERLLPST